MYHFDTLLEGYVPEPVRVTCEHPRVIVNRRYSKLGAVSAFYANNIDYYLQVPCGRCRLCKQRIAKEWKVRLECELQHTRTHRHNGRTLPRCAFITFTVSDKYYTDDDKFFAPWLVKFRDNYRKAYGRSPRYWAITDRGSQFGRLHLHMLLFDPCYWDKIEKRYTKYVSINNLYKQHHLWWPYGFVDIQWVRSAGAGNYVTGYLSGANLSKDGDVKHGKPICEKALRYKPRVFPSKGIGKQYIEDEANAKRLHDNNYIDLNGYIFALPRYYKQKIFTETELYYQLMASQLSKQLQFAYYARHRGDIKYKYGSDILSPSYLDFRKRENERFLTPAPPRLVYDNSYFDNMSYDTQEWNYDHTDALAVDWLQIPPDTPDWLYWANGLEFCTAAFDLLYKQNKIPF